MFLHSYFYFIFILIFLCILSFLFIFIYFSISTFILIPDFCFYFHFSSPFPFPLLFSCSFFVFIFIFTLFLFLLSFPGVRADEVLPCEDGAVFPPVSSEDDLQHCEGVHHLPPYIREMREELRHCESVHHLPPHVCEGQVGAVFLPPGIGGDEDLLECFFGNQKLPQKCSQYHFLIAGYLK